MKRETPEELAERLYREGKLWLDYVLTDDEHQRLVERWQQLSGVTYTAKSLPA